jgi:hypothetical protein
MIQNLPGPSAAWEELIRGKIFCIDLTQLEDGVASAEDLSYKSLTFEASAVVNLLSLEHIQHGLSETIARQLSNHGGDAVPVAIVTIGSNGIVLDLTAITYAFDILSCPPSIPETEAQLKLHFKVFCRQNTVQRLV